MEKIKQYDVKIFIDMDGVLADFYKRAKEMIEKEPDIKYPQSQYGFFTSLEPIKDAIYTYTKLSEQFDVYILTAPSYMNPLCYTEKRVWVEKYLGMEAAKKMIICGYKNLIMGDYLIDDNDHGKGQDKFSGELIKFNQETNNWTDILTYFNDQYINN